MPSEPLLRCRDLHYAYLDRFRALDGVSFDVAPGETLALLGANGCGKSTLLKVLDGLIFPSAGTYHAFGQEVTEDHLEDEQFATGFRSRVGFIFQNTDAQVFSPSVREEVAFGPLQLGIGRDEVEQRIDDVLAMLEIADLADRAPYQLSGGQKKRVAIASVLATNPELILFDEPTAALDPRTQQWLLELIVELGRAGKTIVLATHDLDVLDWVCTRCLVFGEEHRIVRGGHARRGARRPRHPARGEPDPPARAPPRPPRARPPARRRPLRDRPRPADRRAGAERAQRSRDARYALGMTVRDKAAELRRLHDDPDLLVMVNVWDVVSATTLAGLDGCRAIATASHSVAAAAGYPDGEHIPRDEMLEAVRRIAAAVEVPGQRRPRGRLRRRGRDGAPCDRRRRVGANIEDQMRPFDEAVATVAAVTAAADKEGVPFALNARTDAFLLAGDRDSEEVLDEAVQPRPGVRRGRCHLRVRPRPAERDDGAAARGRDRPAQGERDRGARLAVTRGPAATRRRARLARPVVAADRAHRLGRRRGRDPARRRAARGRAPDRVGVLSVPGTQRTRRHTPAWFRHIGVADPGRESLRAAHQSVGR